MVARFRGPRPRCRAHRLRADRRRRTCLGNGPRLRARSYRLRPADRLVPGHQTHAGRHVRHADAWPLECLLRRLGSFDRCCPASRSRGDGARQRHAGLSAMCEELHPGARRHGLHLAVRLPPPLSAFERARAGAWLDANAPSELLEELKNSGFGFSALKSIDPMVAAKAWQKRKSEGGWACLHWPKEYGGRGATPIERVIWQQEEGPYAQLSFPFTIGHGMCGPTLMAYASEEQKRRYLPPLASGEEVWCQLFSEPSAGSDLAGLRTRAERDGEDWVINGQKIWTSGAHFSDFGILITRTDPTVPKHQGMTMFFLDMKSKGVDIRPIKQVNGQSGFNEVYFTDVRIPDSQRLGKVGGGWQVSLTTLMNERLSIGANMPTGFPELFDFCCHFATPDGPIIEDRAVRSKLATWAVRASGLKYTAFRTISALSKGETPGPENSIGKLVAGSTMQEIATFALDLQGQMGVHIDPDDAAASRFQAMLLRSPATRIEGGTDEILRNIIAERVLGLPPDIRVDKDVPFNRIPTKGRDDHDLRVPSSKTMA